MTTNTTKLLPIWQDETSGIVKVIDQRKLPHDFVVLELNSVDDIIMAIREMVVRGAPLIGQTAAYGVYIAALACTSNRDFDEDGFTSNCNRIKAARPTAVNLAWAVDRVATRVRGEHNSAAKVAIAQKEAVAIARYEADNCRKIGEHGLTLIAEIARRKSGEPVNILTHCNAGWLACGEYGTATAPIYLAAENGIDVHVWVDETRPLNQGSRLTAWELGRSGVPHTVITDNAGGHLMQHGRVDLVIVGTDRTTYTGDVANKIGTYLKALAAHDNGVPFYVALPSTTFDWTLRDGAREIPIEERDADEVRMVQGLKGGKTLSVMVPPAESPAGNYAFDVTPARLVTGFITERGICKATEADILKLFPEKTSAPS
jgi:methylthioribose-1-phosphate isomerase